MRYNDNSFEQPEVVIDVTTEPVSLAEIKRALNMQFDTSGAYVFNDDDTYLGELNTRCRSYIENYTGLSLAPKTLKVPVRNELGGVEIPYGPITAITSVVDKDGIVQTTTTQGNQFKTIESPCSCYLVVSYTAGYAAGKIPADLKQAIIEEVVWRYSNRGDQEQEFANGPVSLCQTSINLATPFKRKSFLV
jgi:hypothetical protein